MIFIWKISQGLVSGYEIPFSVNSRTGRSAVSAQLASQSVPGKVRVAKENSLRVKGCQLFNLLPAVIRNADHGDILMFKNNLDHYLSKYQISLILYMSNSKTRLWLVFTLFSLFLLAEHFVQ